MTMRDVRASVIGLFYAFAIDMVSGRMSDSRQMLAIYIRLVQNSVSPRIPTAGSMESPDESAEEFSNQASLCG